MKFVFPTKAALRYQFPTHVNELVVDRSESQASEVFVVVLNEGQAPPLHIHHDTEQVFFVTEGHGILTIGQERREFAVTTGDIVRVPVSTWHSIRAVDGAMRYVAVDCFPGGRPSAEPTWDAHVRTVCREQKWNYDDVLRGG
jgi:mannose-6-phosphate isomerase-like protein (cupin superfamily)